LNEKRRGLKKPFKYVVSGKVDVVVVSYKDRLTWGLHGSIYKFYIEGGRIFTMVG